MWAGHIDRGRVRMATLTRLELGYSARGRAWRAESDMAPLVAMPIQHLTPAPAGLPVPSKVPDWYDYRYTRPEPLDGRSEPPAT